MHKALVLAVGALKGKSIQCISQTIAPRMLRLHAHQMFIDIDLLSILTVVGEDLQGDYASSAFHFGISYLNSGVPMRRNLPKLVGQPDRGSEAIS